MNNNTNTTPDLISINGLDEMQRGQAYKIAFNCFKAFYWGNIILGALLVLVTMCFIENPTIISTCSVIGLAIALLASVIYIVFAVKTSQLGAMNPQFVNISSSSKQIIVMTILGFGYFAVQINRYMEGESISLLYSCILVAMVYGSHIITYLLARKSKKLMSEETEEE